MKLEDIEQQSFKPSPLSLALGFPKGAVWLKLEIADNQVIHEQLYFKLISSQYDEVVLYEKNKHNSWVEKKPSSDEMISGSLPVEFNGSTKSIYLRIKDNGLTVIPTQLFKASEREKTKTTEIVAIAATCLLYTSDAADE